MTEPPIIKYIRKSQKKFLKQYGFPAERLHGSRAMIRVLHRWFAKQYPNAKPTYDGAEVQGMQVVHATKNTPHVEFWLSAVRDGKVHSLQSRVEPKSVEAMKAMNPLSPLIIESQPELEIPDES